VRQALHLFEAPVELRVRLLQGPIGVDPDLARQIHHGEQEITQLIDHRFPYPPSPIPAFSRQLRDLFLYLLQRALRIRPVEADARGVFLESIRLE